VASVVLHMLPIAHLACSLQECIHAGPGTVAGPVRHEGTNVEDSSGQCSV
jgi:hypothetical protein